MLQKILNFLKLRLIETSGLVILTLSIFYLYSVVTYSPENATLVTPGKTDDLFLVNFSFYLSDFLLQAFGISCFLLFLNLFIWSWLIIIRKKVSNISIKFLFIVIYLCLFTFGLKILFNQNFWLPDNGNGGFLGAYLITLIPLDYYNYNNIFAYSALSLAFIFFVLSLGLSLSQWLKIFEKTVIILILPFKIIGLIFKKAGSIDQNNIDDSQIETVPTINQSFKPKSMETQTSLPFNNSNSFSFKSGEYKLPLISFLNETKGNKNSEILTDNHKELSKFLENTLLDFGIMGKIKKVSPGPVVTLYEFEPAAGIKTSKIVNLTDDIARSTSSISTRIAPVPGKNTIGIEIPNKEIDPVNYRQIIESSEFANPKVNIPITLGKTIAGYPIVGDLVSMPHLLIAGTTGSGKSVCINTLILSILYKHTPETCKLILIDPKMLELSIYEDIPHLLTPVVTNPNMIFSSWDMHGQKHDHNMKESEMWYLDIRKPHMAINNGGVILNIASDLGIIAPNQDLYSKNKFTKPVTYSVVKHGIIGLTKYTASYWAKKKIRCNAIAPGGMFNNQNKNFLNKINKIIPLGRMAKKKEYDDLILFLCSQASSYMTGSVVVADGGRTII